MVLHFTTSRPNWKFEHHKHIRSCWNRSGVVNSGLKEAHDCNQKRFPSGSFLSYQTPSKKMNRFNKLIHGLNMFESYHPGWIMTFTFLLTVWLSPSKWTRSNHMKHLSTYPRPKRKPDIVNVWTCFWQVTLVTLGSPNGDQTLGSEKKLATGQLYAIIWYCSSTWFKISRYKQHRSASNRPKPNINQGILESSIQWVSRVSPWKIPALHSMESWHILIGLA